MHKLIRFINSKYADAFLNGEISMGTLSTYWEKDEDIGKSLESIAYRNATKPGLTDLFEGVVSTADEKKLGLPKEFYKEFACDPKLRSVGYRYCNVACFTWVEYTWLGLGIRYNGTGESAGGLKKIIWDMDDRLKTFGDAAVIIDDEQEFKEKVLAAATREGYKVLCGRVNYHPLEKAGIMTPPGNLLHLIAKNEDHSNLYVDVPEDTVLKSYDGFDKSILYEWQKEWRIALYRGVKEERRYTLNIGDIHDCAHWVYTKNLDKELKKLLSRKKIMCPKDSYFGNTNRSEMRSIFHALGENKAEVLVTLGNAGLEADRG